VADLPGPDGGCKEHIVRFHPQLDGLSGGLARHLAQVRLLYRFASSSAMVVIGVPCASNTASWCTQGRQHRMIRP
jgi:hypothetical protein